ncbi:MAG: ABC transporter permease [Bacteroidales bacterium]|nr:ABC transporter permease [Bacteroidales bacterium]MCI2121128.1 ABC transporter permease [Bacteroidales bacterium]
MINIISMISAAGIAVGCMALIIILSIYNGFDSLVRSLYSTYEADLIIKPAKGKFFSTTGEAFDDIRRDPGVKAFIEVAEDNVFMSYDNAQSVATIRGVDTVFERITRFHDYIVEGKFEMNHGQTPEAVVGRTLARDLDLSPRFVTPLMLYYPERGEDISLIDPSSSLNLIKVYPSGVFSLDDSYDKQYVFIPLQSARKLFGLDSTQVSEVQIMATDSSNVAPLQKRVEAMLGDGYEVRDRYRQNESMYKVLVSEKLAIYLILIFVVIIISCNVFGSLSMLIIEKKDDIGILSSMGAGDKLIKNIFVTEGWMISLLGIAVGVLLGLLICFLQQRFGIVKMPGNFIIEAYPVEVRWTDVAIVVAGVGLIGYLIARIPLIFFRRQREDGLERMTDN